MPGAGVTFYSFYFSSAFKNVISLKKNTDEVSRLGYISRPSLRGAKEITERYPGGYVAALFLSTC